MVGHGHGGLHKPMQASILWGHCWRAGLHWVGDSGCGSIGYGLGCNLRRQHLRVGIHTYKDRHETFRHHTTSCHNVCNRMNHDYAKLRLTVAHDGHQRRLKRIHTARYADD